MNTIDAIEKRRSVRKFLEKKIPDDVLIKILNAGIEAPSGKNRQPWKYIVITEKTKNTMLQIMETGIRKEKELTAKNKLAVNSSAENTLRVMREAPVTVFVVNSDNDFLLSASVEEKFHEIVNVQSIGASIQNMLLEATELGIGSLWICDIFSAYTGLCEWLNIDTELIAAVSFGYANESPERRPRKTMEDVTEWR